MIVYVLCLLLLPSLAALLATLSGLGLVLSSSGVIVEVRIVAGKVYSSNFT